MKKILVIGSTNVDFVIAVDNMPQVGETIVSDSFCKQAGGKGANQAYACGMLGGCAEFLSAVGNDSLSDIVLENMHAAGVQTKRVKIVNEASTGLAVITVNHQGDNSIIVVPGANVCCNETYVLEHLDAIRKCDILLIQMEIPLSGVYRAIREAHSMGKIIILNPAPCPNSISDDILSLVDYITPNETELQKLTGRDLGSAESIQAAAEELLNRGAKCVIVTLGERGAMLCSRTVTSIYPAFQIHAVDTTAAGDTFNAAIAIKLSVDASLEEAIRFANAASAISVSRAGAQKSIPSQREVKEFIKSMGDKQ